MNVCYVLIVLVVHEQDTILSDLKDSRKAFRFKVTWTDVSELFKQLARVDKSHSMFMKCKHIIRSAKYMVYSDKRNLCRVYVFSFYLIRIWRLSMVTDLTNLWVRFSLLFGYSYVTWIGNGLISASFSAYTCANSIML